MRKPIRNIFIAMSVVIALLIIFKFSKVITVPSIMENSISLIFKGSIYRGDAVGTGVDNAARKCGDGQLYCKKLGTDIFGRRLSVFNRSAAYCEDLVHDWAHMNMSKKYFKLLPAFETKFLDSISDQKEAEGHSNQVPEEMMVLHYLASTESVRIVCETGFNYGHSSFNFLTSNPNLKVHSFDLGAHVYAKRMAVSLPEVLSADGENGAGRLVVRFGDSTVEVPKAASSKSLPLCDIIFVDGGHTYPVARADILNLARHSSEHSLIIFDDYPTNWGAGFGKAWEEFLITEKKADEILKNLTTTQQTRKEVHIVETLRCTKRNLEKNFQRGFVAGRIILH